jgi:hypothetical protein
MVWPEKWFHDASSGTLTATAPGTGVAHIALNSSQRYELWLGGEFSRGFEISIDGHHVARIRNQLSNIGDYAPVTDLFLTAGVHKFELRYPPSDLAPGSGDQEFTALTAIALAPLEGPPAEMLTVDPSQAKTLCRRPLDWIEVVAPA